MKCVLVRWSSVYSRGSYRDGRIEPAHKPAHLDVKHVSLLCKKALERAAVTFQSCAIFSKSVLAHSYSSKAAPGRACGCIETALRQDIAQPGVNSSKSASAFSINSWSNAMAHPSYAVFVPCAPLHSLDASHVPPSTPYDYRQGCAIASSACPLAVEFHTSLKLDL